MTPAEWVSPLASAAVVGLASWVAVKTTLARLEQRMDDRDEDYSRRLGLIEPRVGLGPDSNGSAAFTRREAEALAGKLEQVNLKLGDLESEVREIDAKVDEVLRRNPGVAG